MGDQGTSRRGTRAVRRIGAAVRRRMPTRKTTNASIPTVARLDGKPAPGEHMVVRGEPFFVTAEAFYIAGDGDSEAGFIVFKPAELAHRLLELAAAGRYERVVELGIYQGGSTAFLHQAFDPDLLIAFELEPTPAPALDRFIDTRGLRDRVRTHYGVDQSDTERLLRLVAEDVAGASLDLVIDDASHCYLPTRASFEALFPLLREGGLYVIEDWGWSHADSDYFQGGGYLPGEPALTNVLVEIMMLSGTRRDIVREIRIHHGVAEIVRGDAPVDAPMDLASLTLNRGNPFRPFL